VHRRVRHHIEDAADVDNIAWPLLLLEKSSSADKRRLSKAANMPDMHLLTQFAYGTDPAIV
jgi:hypothetical protein